MEIVRTSYIQSTSEIRFFENNYKNNNTLKVKTFKYFTLEC